MKIINLPTDKVGFVRHYLQLLNGLMQLTEMELKVLVRIVLYGGVVSADVRRSIKEDLELKSMGNVNNYIKALKDKKILDEDLRVSKLVTPDIEGISFQFLWQASPSEE